MGRFKFLKALSLPEFMDCAGTEEQCEQALVAAREPGGFAYPTVGAKSGLSDRYDPSVHRQMRGSHAAV